MVPTNQIMKSSTSILLVRKGGLEPPCLSAPPPQDGVSANFTTSALDETMSSQKYSKADAHEKGCQKRISRSLNPLNSSRCCPSRAASTTSCSSTQVWG